MAEGDHKYTVTITAHDRPGVIVRIAQVYARRGHSIEALNVVRHDSEGAPPTLYVTAYGKRERIDQIVAQIAKLVDIVDVHVSEER